MKYKVTGTIQISVDYICEADNGNVAINFVENDVSGVMGYFGCSKVETLDATLIDNPDVEIPCKTKELNRAVSILHDKLHAAFTDDFKLKMEDVWGKRGCNDDHGMIVARGGQACPIFKDILPHKSVTVVCEAKQKNEVVHWLNYVHGGNSVRTIKELPDGKIAIRSDYQCW